MHKVKLKYFKESGKFYSDGEFETTLENMYDIFDLVKLLKYHGYLPGLFRGSIEFHITIDVPTHEFNYPALIPFNRNFSYAESLDVNIGVGVEFNRLAKERNEHNENNNDYDYDGE